MAEQRGIVVQKYGGSSVADPERMGRVADRIAALRASGKGVVVVVSAMGDTTDELLALSRAVTENPPRRELDMLLSAGERISMALLSMALNARGVPAVSFTGSQSGIITNDAHTNARILEVRPYRVQDELERGNVVIVAGYQGVSYKKDVTTLGRGGSDTTAVALAAALDAEACEIYSDVSGVFSADPRVVGDAVRLSELSYEEMQAMAESGARVLNAHAVEFAKDRGIALYARSTFGDSGETVIRRLASRTPGSAVAVAAERGLLLLTAKDAESFGRLVLILAERGIEARLSILPPGRGASGFLLVSLENVHDAKGLKADLLAALSAKVEIEEGLGGVSLVGLGLGGSLEAGARAAAVLAQAGLPCRGLSSVGERITFLVDGKDLDAAARLLHEAFVLSPAGKLKTPEER